MASSNSPADPNFWRNVKLDRDVPSSVEERQKHVKVLHRSANIMDVEMFYREALPPPGVSASNQSIILLHGRSFSSETWEELETLSKMAALGHRVIAPDLPGYGSTPGKLTGDRGQFILGFMKALGMTDSRPVLVSPSMSGEYSMSFIREHWAKLSGYIPVAPVATNSVPASVLEKVLVPTLIVYGEHDNTGLAEAALKNLSVMPNSREVKLTMAGHPAYLNQPDKFHKLLYNFLITLHDLDLQ